jgi:hypothetical protein
MIIYLTGDFQHTYITYLFSKWLRYHKPDEKIFLVSPDLNNENDRVIGILSGYASSFMCTSFKASRSVLHRIDHLKDVSRDIDKGLEFNKINLDEEVIFLGLNVIEAGFFEKLRRGSHKGPRFWYTDKYLQLWDDTEKYLGDLGEVEITPEELGYLLGVRFQEADEHDKKRKGIPEKLWGERWFDGVEILKWFDDKIDIERAIYYYPRTGIVLFGAVYKIIFENGYPVFEIFIPYNEKDKYREPIWSELVIFISAIKFLIPFCRFYITIDRRNESVSGPLDYFEYHLNIPWKYWKDE